MKLLWTHRDIDAPAEVLWDLLTDPDRWPEWGPSVKRAELRSGKLELGATGAVTTIVGIDLPFEVVAYEPGVRWAWKVAGVGATDHRVEPRGSSGCRVAFGVPWPAAPYLGICQVALQRLDRMACTADASA